MFSNEDEYEDELKALGLEDSGADVNVVCYTDKQKFRYSFCGYVVLGSFNMASKDEDNNFDKIYKSKHVWIDIMMILNMHFLQSISEYKIFIIKIPNILI